jgi:futalosine hydrolase
LQKKLGNKKYDLVIQAGIAGAFKPGLELGSVTLIEQDTFGDLGMEENGRFTSIVDSGFQDKNEFPYTEGWLKNHSRLLKSIELPVVDALTVNKVSDRLLQQHPGIFPADIETMEGAALHYVCLQEGVEFLQIRSISNYVGVRDKGAWKIKEAIENLNSALSNIVTSIQKGKTGSIDLLLPAAEKQANNL